jgi:hypothetical protein
MYNLATAAAAAGINKSTVFRAIKGGRISAQRDDNGQWHIDPAEFHRVFPPLPAAATVAQQQAQNGATTDALVATLNKVIEDLRADRDHWRDAFESSQRQITVLAHQRATAETTETTEATKPAPVTLPPLTKGQRLAKFWFGREYRRRA